MDNEFLTPDLQLSAFLVALGHEPVRIEGPHDRRVFVFVNLPPEDIAAYHRGTRPVAPDRLFTAYRQLKRQLFE